MRSKRWVSKDSDKGPKTIQQIREEVRFSCLPGTLLQSPNFPSRLLVLLRLLRQRRPASKPTAVAVVVVVPPWVAVMLAAASATTSLPLKTLLPARSVPMTCVVSVPPATPTNPCLSARPASSDPGAAVVARTWAPVATWFVAAMTVLLAAALVLLLPARRRTRRRLRP